MKTLALKRRRDIGRQKWQFIAVLVTVVLGVSMFSGMFNSYLNLGSSLEGSYDRLAMADATVTGADEGFVDTVQEINGVAHAMERRQADVPMDVGEYSFVGRTIAMPTDGQPAINMIDIDEGTYLDPSDSTQVVVETHMAGDFELEVGDTFTIAGQEVTVAGIATSPEYLWPAKDAQNMFTPPRTFGVVFVDEDILESVTSPAVVDQVLVRYGDDVETEEVDGAVTTAADSAGASDVQLLEDQPSNSAINEEIGGLQTMAVALPLLFLAAAGMAIYVVITRLVFSQRGVIGTLRASGFSARTLSRHYRSYGVMVGLIGAAIGSVFGGFMSRGMTALYTEIFSIPDLVANVHIPTIILALTFGVVAGVIAGSAPARTVARMEPAEAMRGDVVADGGKRSLFETLVPPLRGAPVRWRMTFRGIGRNKKRSLAMVLGVVLAMTLILASWGMLDTMLVAMDDQFNEIAIEDATVAFAVPVEDEQVGSITAVDGVRHSEAVIGLGVTIRSSTAAYSTLLEGYQRGTSVHGFEDPLPSSGILVGRAMGDVLDIDIGDRVTVEVPSLDTEFSTNIAGYVDELATVGYMAKDVLESSLADSTNPVPAEALSSPAITTVKSLFDEGASTEAVVERIKDVDGVAAVVDSTEIRALVESFQAFFYVFIGIALVFGGAMAFALIFNIISVNVAERSSEFASMRANGLTHRKVATLIMGETFLLTGIGVIPGLIVGTAAALAFMNSFSSDQFPIVAQIRPVSYAATVIAMFVVAGLSLIPAVRAVKRINVGEIVRERSV